jgi:O-antigen biosynthesis protein WbqP
MPIDTPALATHLVKTNQLRLTPVGGFLRRSSLDELPQLWSILQGDMSFVGPRPALFNQHDLIELRQHAGVDVLTPGVTGLAQVNGRDNLSIPEKVALDAEYLRTRGFVTDIRILLRTIDKVLRSEGVQH